MNPFPIKSRLLRLTRRKRAARLWTGLAVCWLIASVVGLGFVAWAAIFGWLPRAALPCIVTIGGLGAVGLWLRHRRTAIDWRGCAREIESRRPELDGRLMTAIEQQPDERGRFTYLQNRLFNEVLAHDRMFDWARFFPVSRLGWIKLAHAGAFALFVITCLRLGTMQTGSPGGERVAGGVVVTPGDTQIERGTTLVVTVRFNTGVPAGVDLAVRPKDGPSRRIPLVRSLQDPVFGTSLPEVAEDLDYVVEYGGRCSRPFEVRVFDYPRLERADADLTYPEFTGLAPKRIEDTRRITAVQGTRVDLVLQLNKPIQSAQLLPGKGGGAPLTLAADPEVAEARLAGFALSDSERYALQLVDADGRTNKQAVQFVFQALSNRAPEMKMTSPRRDIRPSALEEVSVQGTVFDDFGVLAYGLTYDVGGGDVHTVELGGQVPAKEKREFHHVLSLEDLGVQPGDLVSWFCWSEDIGPDGGLRQTVSDLYFAEIRPFEEIFRQGQSQYGRMSSPQQGGGGQQERLLELQQQIIHATWKLQRQQGAAQARPAAPRESSMAAPPGGVPTAGHLRRGERLNGFLHEMIASSQQRGDGRMPFFGQRLETRSEAQRLLPVRQGRGAPTATAGDLAEDLQVLIEAQQNALNQAREARQELQDPTQSVQWDTAIEQMESALKQLTNATTSSTAFRDALAAQQAAYQQLLKLQEREYSVSRNQSGSSGANQGGRQQQIQRQLDQLELTPEENRYETERLAQAPQSAEQREQLQVMSRLAELARRQQDITERLQELQVALQAAKTEEKRQLLRQELKRLQEDQQQMLSDVDELRQRLDSQENQSRFTDQREQLEQTRESVQRAAESARQGATSEAIAAGTRAQREMQQMREELRNQSAGAFADDMRQLRSDARDLARQQGALQDQIEELDDGTQKRLSDSDETSRVHDRLQQQRQRLTNLVDRASQVSQLAWEAEPLMSSELYDTLREFSQDDLGAVKELQEALLAHDMYQLYEQLKPITEDSEAKTLDTTAAVLGEGYPELARQTGQRALQDINELARGIEQAAELVVGDDTEALRRAQQQLQELTQQLEQEVARAADQETNTQAVTSPDGSGTNSLRPPSGSSRVAEARTPGNSPPTEGDEPANNADPSNGGQGSGLAQAQGAGSQSSESEQSGNGNRGAEGQGSPGNGTGSAAGDSPSASGEFDLDRFLSGGPGGDSRRAGPIAGDGFGPWSDGLREVEELVEWPDLRNDVTRARERARNLRRDYTRNRQKPDWVQVQLQVLRPLVEVQRAISEELVRRQSPENLVPIDRDPVPDRYSELVRRYYEELGKDRD